LPPSSQSPRPSRRDQHRRLPDEKPGPQNGHHGDLRAALIEAAVKAAREGGEHAIRLRRLTAGIGVSPAAAYRHFPRGLSELLLAVGDFGRQELEQHIMVRAAEVKPSPDAAATARRRFRASSQAYLEYVLEHPALFQVAVRHKHARSLDTTPVALLERYVAELATTPSSPPHRRLEEATGACATVNGLALLLTVGCLRLLPIAHKQIIIDQTLDMVLPP